MRPARKQIPFTTIKSRLALLLSLCALPPLALYSAGIRDTDALAREPAAGASGSWHRLVKFGAGDFAAKALSLMGANRVARLVRPPDEKLDPALPTLLLPMVLANQLNEIGDRPRKSYDERIRKVEEAAALTKIGAPLVPIMLQAIRDYKHLDVVFEMFDRISPEAKDTIPLLIDALQDENSTSRFTAAKLLARLIRHGAPPRLLELLNHPDARVRAPALQALAQSGLYSLDTLPALRNALDDPDRDVRLSIYISATHMRNRPMTAEALVDKLYDEDDNLKRTILWYMSNLDMRPWVERLLPLLEHEDSGSHVREYALQAIALGARMPPFILPRVMAGLEDENLEMRSTATRILRKSHLKPPRSLIPGLIRNMRLKDGSLEWESAQLLMRMRAIEAIPALRKLTRTGSPRSRWVARYTIREILKKTANQ